MHRDVDLDPLSDGTYEPALDALVVVSADEKQALVVGLDGAVRSRFDLPGKKPEGLAFLPNGDMLVVDDAGGVWRVRGALAATQSSGH